MLSHGLFDRLIGIGTFPRGPGPGEAEIGDPQLTGTRNKEIARFEIAVDDAVVVEEFQAFKDLVHEEAEVGVREGLFRLDDSMEIRVEELHDYVELVFGFSEEEVFEGDYVLVCA
eukprot:evm.model.NODE_2643_length_17297_cov_37.226223.1